MFLTLTLTVHKSTAIYVLSMGNIVYEEYYLLKRKRLNCKK